MRWADDGIFLSGRPHGETSVVANIFTRANGRTMGLVKGGRSRRIRPLLQTGNELKVEWRARLEEQLGVYTAEMLDATAARVLDDRLSLAGVNAVAALLQELPERDPHPRLFDAARECLRVAGNPDFARAMIRFELVFLDELGFGLDRETIQDQGRAAREGPFHLGKSLSEKFDGKHSARDIEEGLAFTGYFLNAHVFAEAGKAMPRARADFLRYLERSLR
jgi:DNA repair protein RecO (recombination protein O)